MSNHGRPISKARYRQPSRKKAIGAGVWISLEDSTPGIASEKSEISDGASEKCQRRQRALSRPCSLHCAFHSSDEEQENAARHPETRYQRLWLFVDPNAPVRDCGGSNRKPHILALSRSHTAGSRFYGKPVSSIQTHSKWLRKNDQPRMTTWTGH